ncbi:hypothetical protein [Microbacterium rhizophilus]|uniref:hypothetical protein n=1 Tax=Microbacterium rhizophilus TaxID=3138934 RepID=UPI0031E57750
MARILTLAAQPPAAGAGSARVDVRDAYDLGEIDLGAYAGLAIDAGCDQRLLARHAERLTAWVRAGGRLFANGHLLTGFVEGLPAHRKLDFHSTRDLWLTETGSHPIWDGIDRRDLLFHTGVPGPHTFEDLERVGVAGFYAHAYFVDLPDGAVAITGIGHGALPVDVAYPLGAGEVILHIGNDVMGFTRPGTTAHDLGERVLAHLEQGKADR